MPTYAYTVSFEVARPNTLTIPGNLLGNGGRYEVAVEEDGSVNISGNRDGLLFLGEMLIRHAIGGLVEGFHSHLPLTAHGATGPNMTAEPELTIFSAVPE